MVAHRGLSGLEKENTNAAFVAAGNREKYYGIETDVHVTADGRIIVIHDDNTKRVGIDELSVEGSTYETLTKLQLTDIDGKRGRRDLVLPDVDDYVGICKKYEKTSFLELKNPMKAADIEKVIAAVRKQDYLRNTVFISFSLKNLITLRKKLPNQRAMYLIEGAWKDSYYDDLEKYDLGLDIDHRIVTPEIVQHVHSMGKDVNVWTVNTYEDGCAMIDMGVDYITTNILE